MKTRSTFVHMSLLLSFLAALTVPAEADTVVSETVSGKITSVSLDATLATGILVGDTIAVDFAYDSTQAGTGGDYTFTGSAKTHSFSFDIFNSEGVQVFSDLYPGDVMSYYAAQVVYNTSNLNFTSLGTQLSLLGDTLYLGGIGISGPLSPAFDLTLFNPGNVGTTSSEPLPTPTTIVNFISNVGSLKWGDAGNQTFTAEIEAVPEPSTLSMAILVMAMSAIGYSISRWMSAR
jgi:hypothetical protein